MPNRIIRDASKTSPSLAALSDLAERTFWRLIVTLDDYGRYHGSTMALLAAAYPAPPEGLTLDRFQEAIDELEAGDLLRFYEVDGRRYVMSPTWQKYQRLRARESRFPQPLSFLGRGHRAVISPRGAAGVGDGIGNGVVVGDVVHPTTTTPQAGDQGENQPLRRPEPVAYVLSCTTCAEMLNLVNDALASCYSVPGRTGEWLHRAHTVVPATRALEVVKREIAKHAGSPKGRRYLQPIVLWKPENWDTTVNRTEARAPTLAEILGE